MATQPTMPSVGSPTISGNPSGAAATLRRDVRYLWLSVAGLIFALSTYVALTQNPRPNTMQPVRTLSPDWWLHPVERNAFRRLPVIDANLNAVHTAKDGRNVWAVGSNGLIVHSTDGGRTWVRQPWTRVISDGPIETTGTTPDKSAPYTPAPSDTVRRAQTGLRTLGLYKGEANGLMSDELGAAIRTFQQRYGMIADGVAGQATLGAIEKALKESKSPEQRQESPPKSKASISPTRPISLVPDAEASPPQASLPQRLLQSIPGSRSERGTDKILSVWFSDTLTGWAGGDDGTFLYTKDGGNSWKVLTSVDVAAFNAITFTDSYNGWTVARLGNIYHSADGGASWSPQTSGTRVPLIFVAFTDAQTGWGVGFSGTIIHTSDGGSSWVPQTSGTKEHLRSVAFVDVRNGWAIGEGGTIVHTSDGGSSWVPQTSGTGNTLTSVSFTDARNGWVVGEGGTILHTSDAGASWTPQKNGDSETLISVSFADARNGWVVGTDGTILHTADGGSSWVPQTSLRAYGSVAFADARNGWVVGTHGTILHTSDGGSSWVPQTSGTKEHLRSVAFADARNGCVIGWHGTILHTTNGGASWTPVPSGTDGDLSEAVFIDARNGWAVGESGTILHTSDGGSSWIPQPSGTTRGLRSVAFTDARNGWAIGDGGTIVHTSNGGSSWVPQTSGTGEGLYSVAFADARNGWAVGSDKTILHTTDGGASWTSKPSNVGGQLIFITVSDVHSAWVVGEGGTLVHTNDEGSTWVAQNSGTGSDLFSLSFSDDRNGWAVGLGGTLLHTTDGGETWLGGEKGPPFVAYARYPAPWWYLALFGGVLCTTMALRPPQPMMKPLASVADLALSDKPIEAAARDVLNFSPIALGLSNFLRNSATEPPVTLAITGDWGSGKSSLMNLLFADLRDRGFRSIWFNAWHQQKDASLLGSLVSAIRLQGLPKPGSIDGLRFRARLMGERIRARPFVTAAMTFAAAWSITYFGMEPAHLTTAIEWLPRVAGALTDEKGDVAKSFTQQFAAFAALAAVLTPLLTLIRGLRAFGVNPGTLATSVAGSLKQASEQTKVLHDYAQQFRDVARALHPRTLTIFVDDLDRCTPERVRETLEAVNYLVSSGPCFIVLGMARERVEACVGLAFKDVAQEMADLSHLNGSAQPKTPASSEDEARWHRRQYARDYLKKLVNIEVQVPEPTDLQTRGLVGMAPARTADPSAAPAHKPAHGTRALAAAWRAFSTHGLTKWPPALVLAFAIGGWWIASRTPDVAPPSLPPVLTTNSPAPAPGEKTQPSTPVPDRSRSKPDPTSPLSASTVARVIPGQSSPTPALTWIVPILLLAAAALGVRLRRPDVVERDSKDFRAALAVWLPLVAVRQNTPREIKRYVNHVRLLAMRQRAQNDDSGQLDEFTLVALGALNHIDESLLDPPPVSGQGHDAVSRLIEGSHVWANRISGPLKKALSEHMLNAGSWPPPPEAVQRFRDLSGSMRLNY